MTMGIIRTGLCCGMLALAAWTARAEPVRNGNDLALAVQEGGAPVLAKMQKERTNLIHTFRFLKIEERTMPSETNRTARLTTVEPSSDFKVVLIVSGKMSLDLAATLNVGDCVAVRGRLKSLCADRPAQFIVDPAILQFKDNPQPKRGKELLREVDKGAH